LGQEIIVDGHHVHYLQTGAEINKKAQGDPDDLGMDIKIDGVKLKLA